MRFRRTTLIMEVLEQHTLVRIFDSRFRAHRTHGKAKRRCFRTCRQVPRQLQEGNFISLKILTRFTIQVRIAGRSKWLTRFIIAPWVLLEQLMARSILERVGRITTRTPLHGLCGYTIRRPTYGRMVLTVWLREVIRLTL